MWIAFAVEPQQLLNESTHNPPAVLVSAVIAYTAGGIWEKYSVAIGQADVRFTYDMIVVLEGNAGERVWSSYPALNNALAARQISASVQVAEDDFDNDGKVDSFDVTWTGYGAEDVRGVKALCQVPLQSPRVSFTPVVPLIAHLSTVLLTPVHLARSLR